MKDKTFFTVTSGVVTLLLLMTQGSHSNASSGPKTAPAAVTAAAERLPLTFIPNAGQFDEAIVYSEHGRGRTSIFTREGIFFSLRGEGEKTLTGILPVDGLPSVEVTGERPMEGRVNYFLGNNPSEWRTGIPTFGAVRYSRIFPDTDLLVYGREGAIEYDVIVAPGGDPSLARFECRGIDGLHVRDDGALVATAGEREFVQDPPYVYQEIGGEKVVRAGSFEVLPGGRVYSFKIGSYDEKAPLVIDPVIRYATYFGGSLGDSGEGIAVGQAGDIYIAGYTSSADLATAPGTPAQGSSGGGQDCFVSRFSPDGSTLVFSTYLGGSSVDRCLDIALDSEGNAYVTGYTESSNFPLVNNVQEEFGGLEDAFITKIGSDGTSLAYSTYLGGSDTDKGDGIAVSTAGMAFVTGTTLSLSFPVAGVVTYDGMLNDGVITGAEDAFVAKLNAAGTTFDYLTYLGGSSDDGGHGIAIDASGNAYVTGYTFSTDFPTASPIQGALLGTEDVFVTKLNAAGTALTYSTYIGGGDEEFGSDVAVSAGGEAVVSGRTRSSDFPTVNPFQAVHGGGSEDGYVFRLNAAGSALVCSSFIGGSGSDSAVSVALENGFAYLGGTTSSADFPLVSPVDATLDGFEDAFAARVSKMGGISFSTYFGGTMSESAKGVASGAGDNLYLTGRTMSTDMTTVKPYQASSAGGQDAFISILGTGSYSDWNGDGMEDVVWRAYSGPPTGGNHLWYLGITMGTPAVSGTATLPSVPDTDWQINGAPDINGDGMPDLMWRKYGVDPDAGSNYVWYMGMTMGMHAMTGGASLPPAGTNWELDGVPDINRDGMPDLLWRDYSTGANHVWYLGTTLGNMPYVTGTAPLPGAGTQWTLGGTPDCNGDGMPDLVWRDYSTGANYVWYLGMTMGMPAVTGGASLPAAGTMWNLEATPDANLDGKPDLLWRNYSSGANYIWYLGMTMGSPVVTGTEPLSGAAADWQIEN